jgi:YARHG domain/TIR domain
MVDVFISYSRSNQDVVRRLADAVKRLGYDVWWDDELPPHLSYGDVITEKIGEAKAAIVVWSQGSTGSEWVRAEADLARNQKKLIQTSIDDCMPPMPFNQIQFASLGDWDGAADHSGWRKVQASLTALCGPPSAGSVPPQAPSAPPAVVPSPMPSVPPMAQAPMPSTPPTPLPTSPPRTSPPQGVSKTNIALISAIAGSLAIILLIGALLLFRKSPTPAPANQVVAANAVTPASRAHPANDAMAASDGATDNGRTDESGDGAGNGEASDPDETLPGSDRRMITEEELANLSNDQLRLARNEIYARHGRIFRDPQLAAHFSRYSWYNPTEEEVALSPTEQANVDLIARVGGF